MAGSVLCKGISIAIYVGLFVAFIVMSVCWKRPVGIMFCDESGMEIYADDLAALNPWDDENSTISNVTVVPSEPCSNLKPLKINPKFTSLVSSPYRTKTRISTLTFVECFYFCHGEWVVV